MLTPTRELAQQIQSVIQKIIPKDTNINSKVFCGGIPRRLDIVALKRGVDIAVCTPGRLNDLMSDETIDLSQVDSLIFDETDEMLKIGFQKEIDLIINEVKYNTKMDNVQVILFSATVPPWVKKTTQDFMRSNRVVVDLVKHGDMMIPTTVKHYSIFCPNTKEKINSIASLINCFNTTTYKVIVFCSTRGNFCISIM